MAKTPHSFNQVRRKIESAMEQAEEERHKRLLSRRLELARNGVAYYQRGQITDAVKAFHSYIRILEELKNVSEGGLMPSCFDLKTELPELMVLSGVYWDLIKIYDHAQSQEKHKEFLHYLEKYIIFAKGFPYQTLSAETLRKYISNRKGIHMSDFKNAYEIIGDSKCFLATSLIDVSSENTLPTLRKWRDEVMMHYSIGKWFVKGYYQISPRLVGRMNRLPTPVRKLLALGLDGIAYCCRQLL